MPQTKLYFAPGTCSLAPHILLREAGVEFEAIANSVTLKTVTFAEGFELLNPKMRVPVLVLDGVVITELPAIVTAIAQLVPNMRLMGKGQLETVRVYEWMNWLSGTLHGQAFGAFDFLATVISKTHRATISVSVRVKILISRLCMIYGLMPLPTKG
jgi:glutathione S-transferase